MKKPANNMNIQKALVPIVISTVLLFSCGFSAKMIGFQPISKKTNPYLGKPNNISVLTQSKYADFSQTSIENMARITQADFKQQGHRTQDDRQRGVIDQVSHHKLARIGQKSKLKNGYVTLISSLARLREQQFYRTKGRRSGKFMLNYLNYALTEANMSRLTHLSENDDLTPRNVNMTYKTQNADLFMGQIATDNPTNLMPQGNWGNQANVAQIFNQVNLASENVQQAAQTLVHLNR